MLQSTAGFVALSLAHPPSILHASNTPRKLGISTASYGIRWRSGTRSQAYPQFRSALDLLDHCARIGAGGLQVSVAGWHSDFAGKARALRERHGLFLEGQIGLPKDALDLQRFDSELKAAREAGAEIVRTVCLSTRRYETFESLAEFDEFRRRSWGSLTIAEPLARKHRIKVAVENHKDWRVPELIEVLNRLGSEWVGATLDTGNSIALLEHPLAAIAALAPFAFTTHFKDMALRSSDDGFLLAEVPLGKGVLDLPEILKICQRANPSIRFNLEMITRDPLSVPCLTAPYWATLAHVPGPELARTLALARSQDKQPTLQMVSTLEPEAQLALEEENVRQSLAYAKSQLAFE